MALEITAPVQSSTPLESKRRGRDAGPNPFLDNGWVVKSYNEGSAYETGPYAGGIEEYVIQSGANEGNTATRYTGDVKDVVSLIRAAARAEDIGVAVQVTPVKGSKTKFMIKYLGQEPKQTKKRLGQQA